MAPKPLNYLPLNILSRIELDLTQNNLKPSSAIFLRKLEAKKKLEKYLTQNNLFFSTGDDKQLYFVSPRQEVVHRLLLIWSNTDIESEVEKGLLLGYPKAAVVSFARYKNSPKRSQILTGTLNPEFPRSELSYWPYIVYVVRKGFEKTDSLPAKIWADFIRKNNPVLAQWYEKQIFRHLPKVKK